MKDQQTRLYWKRLSRNFLKVILFILLFVLLVIGLLHTPPAQNALRKKAISYLEKKLNTRVEIGRVRLILPERLILEDVYLEDQQQDTLLSGGTIEARLTLNKLLSNEVEVKHLELLNVTAKVKRVLPDTVFNFKFVVDAFTAEKNKRSDTSESAPLKLALDNLALENFNVIYRDVITGDDMVIHVGSLNATIDTLDPYTSRYSVPWLYVNDLVARLKQQQPLVKPETVSTDLAEAARPSPVDIEFGTADLNNIDIRYANEVSSFFTDLKIGRLKTTARNIDLADRIVHLDELQLNNSGASIRLGEKDAARLVAKEIEQEVRVQSEYDWNFKIGRVSINNQYFAYENDNQPRTSRGIDYSHLRADSLTLHVDNFVLSEDSIGGNIRKGSFFEKSGFRLEELRGDVMYAFNQSYLRDLYLKTPGTELKRHAVFNYNSYDDLAHRFPNTQMDVNIDDSYIQVKDILAFAPSLRRNPAFANPEAVWYLDFQGNGTLNSLHIANLQFRGLRNTIIDARGSLAAASDPQRAGGVLTIRRLHTTQTDIALFTGRRLSNPRISFPEEFDVNGTISGPFNDLDANLNISSDMGAMAVNGRFSDFSSLSNARYTALVKTNSLNIGRMFRNPKLGRMNANVAISGRGLDPNSMDARLKGIIYSVGINNYTYRSINLEGGIRSAAYNFDLDVRDPNIDLNGMISGRFSTPAGFRFDGFVDSLKTMPLNLTPQPLVFRGRVEADVPLIDADFLEANVLVTEALFVSGQNRLPLDTLQFNAGRNGSVQFMDLQSDVATAHLSGTYRYSELGKIFRNSIEPYFSVNPAAPSAVQPYDFSFRVDVANAPVLTAFVPGLKSFETIHAEGRVATASGLTAVVNAPFVHYMDNQITGLNLTVNTTAAGLQFNADMQRLKSRTFNIYHTQLNATARNNQLDFTLNIDDAAGRDKYVVAGLLKQPNRGIYELSLRPDNLLLNYEQWTVLPGNTLRISKDHIAADNFVLRKNEQEIRLQSAGEQLNVGLTNFQISTITGFMKSDSLAVNGSMTGNITFRNILRQPVFTSDLVINDLSFQGDTLGNAVVKVDNISGDRYNANATITGRGNDISLTGTFRPEGSRDIGLDLNLDIRSVQLATLEGAFGGFIKNASGSLSGQVKIGGTARQPEVNGPISFNNASFALSMLGSQFRVDGEKLVLTENGLTFDDFVIRDTTGNTMRLNGMVQTSNFINYYFNLDLEADDFRILNTTKKDNKIYYGSLVITADLHIDGTEQRPIVDGSLSVNEGTEMFIVIPQREPGVIQREGIVEFVDMDQPMSDSLFTTLSEYDSLNIAGVVGMDISTNIEIRKEAVFNIVIDEANGDFINLQGEAQLSTGIDPSGKITLVGTYELERGAYEITFNFLHRRFEIQKGSRIIWLDEPTHATLDVDALYIANTAPIDLVQDQIAASSPAIRNTYMQKLPFEVRLKLTGELMQPIVSFDIVLPEDRSYGVSNDIIIQVNSRLAQLRQDAGEINKQVFSLLLLNRFVGHNPLESNSPFFSASTYVRQSVSKLLTGQLNRLAAGLIDGVDISFDVTATDDYTTGERRSRTDLNIGLSKRLLNERLTVSVGSNFELQGPKNSNQKASNVLGNVAVNYAVSRDGRYMLRFYRRNDYDYIIDGYVIETGLSFLITVDYEHFRELLMSRKKRREALLNPNQP